MKLMDKVVVVTGAGRGIGKAIAEAYAANGAKVCCIARTKGQIENTVHGINIKGGEAIAIPCDVTDYDELERVFKAVDETYGQLDILVINAGIDCKNLTIEDSDVEDWKRVVDVNLNGAFYTAKAAVPFLKQSKGAKVITIGSGMGHHGRARSGAYCCSKSALWMFTRILSQELFEYGISVNELIPGPVITDMGDDSRKDDESAFSVASEWIKYPEDVTDMALFLATQPDIGPSGQSFSLMRRVR